MRNTKNLIYSALGAALIAACSFLTVPAPVPFTLQSLAVLIAAGLLGERWGCVSVLVYLLLGAVGVPVFSGFRGGVGVLFGATGGYLLGFLPMAWLAGRSLRRWKRPLPGIALAMAALYALGTAWYAVLYGGSIGAIVMTCVVPFLIPDALKAALALYVVRRLRGVLPLH